MSPTEFRKIRHTSYIRDSELSTMATEAKVWGGAWGKRGIRGTDTWLATWQDILLAVTEVMDE